MFKHVKDSTDKISSFYLFIFYERLTTYQTPLVERENQGRERTNKKHTNTIGVSLGMNSRLEEDGLLKGIYNMGVIGLMSVLEAGSIQKVTLSTKHQNQSL